MRFGWILSPAAHAGLIAGVLAWPSLFAPPLPELSPDSAIVPVDVVTFADKSNVKAVGAVAPKSEEPPQPEPEGAPQPKEEAAAPEPEALAEADAPPVKKPEKKAEKPKRDKLDFDQLALLLDRSAPDAGQRRPQSSPDAAPGDTPRQAFGGQEALTVSERDALRAQLRECWRSPVDMPNPERLIVRVRIELNRDGSLARQPQPVSPANPASADPPLRVAAENALRAVRVCAPFTLPPEKYERWREIIFTFDPREMVQ